MPETKHFKYEADVTQNIEVKKVQFLVPIRVEATINGRETAIVGQMDCINNKVYFDNMSYQGVLEEKVIAFVGQATSIPADSFEAPNDIYEEANRAQEEHASIVSDVELGE